MSTFIANLNQVKQSVETTLKIKRSKMRKVFLGGKNAERCPDADHLADELGLTTEEVKQIQDAINSAGLRGRGAWLTIHKLLQLDESERGKAARKSSLSGYAIIVREFLLFVVANPDHFSDWLSNDSAVKAIADAFRSADKLNALREKISARLAGEQRDTTLAELQQQPDNVVQLRQQV